MSSCKTAGCARGLKRRNRDELLVNQRLDPIKPALMREAQFLLQGDFREPCIVMTGWHFPVVRVYMEMFSHDIQPSCTIVQLLSREELLSALQDRIAVYYVSGVASLAENVYGYTISDYPEVIYLGGFDQ
jgi:hypothetical protein